ncbi:hypothetical protein BCIN_01g07060 [Botrytis cinerea B05.10]|uniref:Uncharacterized protein n=1 Tax=Botryotinia fuckeliana (strain B05.10) TaxID=332648 RepID=A0A384J5J0_BOTFB|nr:hypothetical protein BCIN_01g07060 [Botrytis cinerea B05.10]ATZ46028.1 hypothetical protein BCIN_01g07060 [Botrytis cinerea B05.10]
MWDVSEKPETRKNDQGIQDQRAENRLGTNRNQTKSGLINNKDYIRPNDDWSKNLCTEMDKRAFEGDGEGKEEMLLGQVEGKDKGRINIKLGLKCIISLPIIGKLPGTIGKSSSYAPSNTE